MSLEEFKQNQKFYWIGVIVISILLLLIDWTWSLGWLVGNIISTIHLVLRDKFYSNILSQQHFNGWFYFLYFVIQLGLVALTLYIALVSHWMNPFALLLGYVFYKYFFVYFMSFLSERR